VPIITRKTAIELLAKAIEQASPDDLADFHNELFPENPVEPDQAVRLAEKVLAHVTNGLEVDELLDLWPVVFPQYRALEFDEEQDSLHYEERRELVEYMD
jgi:uncharacterized Fe-S radical SAM superfamily protein PflX